MLEFEHGTVQFEGYFGEIGFAAHTFCSLAFALGFAARTFGQADACILFAAQGQIDGGGSAARYAAEWWGAPASRR